MLEETDERRLTIGAYAAATQLTAKALRLYDEYGLLKPTTIDPATGYRYYRVEQVATGRLVRVLRDMNCSLSQIAQVLDAPAGLRPALLRDFLHEAEQRLARERTAYQSALMMMRRRSVSADQSVEVAASPAQIAIVTDFLTNRRDVIGHALRHHETSAQQLQSLGFDVPPEFAVSLAEPLTDEEGRVELLIAIEVSERASLQGVTTRHTPERRYAYLDAHPSDLADGFTAYVDGLFDWFDKNGTTALGFPEVLLTTTQDELHAQVRWAFDSGSGAR